jgi:hypothetical protein
VEVAERPIHFFSATLRHAARPDCLRFFGLLVPQLRSSCSTWERRYWEEVLQANTAQLQQDREQDQVLSDDVWETYKDMITFCSTFIS